MSCVCVDVFTVHPIAKKVLLNSYPSSRTLVCVCIVIIQCVSVCVYIFMSILSRA
jgi:hypothetical protein